MTKTREELIEEIPDKIMAEILETWSSCMVMKEISPEEAARQSITCIGEAYARGEMELPGEVGRKGFVTLMRLSDWAYEMFTARAATEFIALSPSGIRKEEIESLGDPEGKGGDMK